MPLLPISSPATIAECKALPLRPSDVFICSYPKSGTTWTQHIVLSLLLAERRCRSIHENDGRGGAKGTTDSDPAHLEYQHVSEYAPFFEIDAHWDHKRGCLVQSIRDNHHRLNRRVFNTHLRWEMLPKTPEENDNDKSNENTSNCTSHRPACGKFIYVTRNLLDVSASFYHHLSNQKEGTYEESFQTFVKDWMDGKVAFGSPLHHLLSFAEGFRDNHYDNREMIVTSDGDAPLLLLSYEKMKNNLRQEVIRIMKFLNLTNIPMDVLENDILPTFEFQAMKNDIQRFQPKSVTWLNNFQFLRRGESGDGRAMMVNAIRSRDGNTLRLLDEYDEWVNSEGYKKHIHSIFSSTPDQNEERNVFLNVVDHS